MLEIKAFKEEYIDEAARLFAASHERERDRLPIAHIQVSVPSPSLSFCGQIPLLTIWEEKR